MVAAVFHEKGGGFFLKFGWSFLILLRLTQKYWWKKSCTSWYGKYYLQGFISQVVGRISSSMDGSWCLENLNPLEILKLKIWSIF